MHAFHVDARRVRGARHGLTEDGGVVDERALEDRRHLEALGHDVEGHDALAIGLGEHFLERRKIRGVQDPRLVAEDMQTGLDRPRDPIDLAAIASREHDDIPRPLAQHPFEEIGAAVDLGLPRGGPVAPVVERRDAFEMFGEIPSVRRVDIDACRHAGIHLLLNQRRVEMTRVESHESHVGRPAAAVLRREAGNRDQQRRHHNPFRVHGCEVGRGAGRAGRAGEQAGHWSGETREPSRLGS